MTRILLVEDELSLRELYGEFLNGSGYSVDLAEDGEVALVKIKQGAWDVLLLDVMLPKLDGIEILRSLKANEALRDKPVLVMSNLEEPEIIQKCLSSGAKEFLVKADLTPPEMLEAIERNIPNEPGINTI